MKNSGAKRLPQIYNIQYTIYKFKGMAGIVGKTASLGMMVMALTWVIAFHSARADGGGMVKGMEIAEFDRMIGGVGKRHLIVIMAAWCAPCRKELPILIKLYDRYKSKGLSMIGLSLDLDGPGAMEPIAREAGVTFPIYWLGEEAVTHYDITAMPMLFLMESGKIMEKIPGLRSEEYLNGKILEFLGKK